MSLKRHLCLNGRRVPTAVVTKLLEDFHWECLAACCVQESGYIVLILSIDKKLCPSVLLDLTEGNPGPQPIATGSHLCWWELIMSQTLCLHLNCAALRGSWFLVCPALWYNDILWFFFSSKLWVAVLQLHDASSLHLVHQTLPQRLAQFWRVVLGGWSQTECSPCLYYLTSSCQLL